jgi:hypothetical protein
LGEGGICCFDGGAVRGNGGIQIGFRNTAITGNVFDRFAVAVKRAGELAGGFADREATGAAFSKVGSPTAAMIDKSERASRASFAGKVDFQGMSDSGV